MSFMPTTASDVQRQTEVEQSFIGVEECAAHIDKITQELEAALGRSILAQRKEDQKKSDGITRLVKLARGLIVCKKRLRRLSGIEIEASRS